jgi:hypothetical protein
MRYVYLGDRWTDATLVGQPCEPVRRADGKVVVSAGKALVVFADGTEHVVMRRRLRLRDRLRTTHGTRTSRKT